MSAMLYPVRSYALGAIIVFGMVLTLAVNAGIFGIAAGSVVLSWFLKYCYLVLERTAMGYAEPPQVETELLNPFDERRPLEQLVVFAVGVFAVRLGYAAGAMVGQVLLLLGLLYRNSGSRLAEPAAGP